MSVSSGFTRESSPFSDNGSSSGSLGISRHGLKLDIAASSSSGFGSSGSLLSSPDLQTPPPQTPKSSHNKRRFSKNSTATKVEHQAIMRKKIPEVKGGPLPATVTFAVRESLYGRKGWMVMPLTQNGSPDMRKINKKDLERIYDDLNSMEIQGEPIPETITVRLNHRD